MAKDVEGEQPDDEFDLDASDDELADDELVAEDESDLDDAEAELADDDEDDSADDEDDDEDEDRATSGTTLTKTRARGATATKARPARKTTARSSRPRDQRTGNPFVALVRFVREVVGEMRKVLWPTRRELVIYTIAVIIFVTVMVSIVGGLDFGFARLILLIFG